VAEGLVEEHHGRYRLSPGGRRTLAERALDGTPLSQRRAVVRRFR
jgi:hypothetical protein